VMAGFGVMLQEFFRKMLEERGTSIHMEISHKTIADHEGILSDLRKKDLPEAQRIMQKHLAVYKEEH
jgi:DNA-binding GntR family transcriptional regulator